MAAINVYCLSGIKGFGKSSGKCMYLLETIYKGEPYTKHWIEDLEDETANSAGLETARRALEKINAPGELVIYTDSNYFEANVAQSIIKEPKVTDDDGNIIKEAVTTSRMQEWKDADWINPKTGEKRANWEKWQQVAKILETHPYKVSRGQHSYTHWMISELKRDQLNSSK